MLFVPLFPVSQSSLISPNDNVDFWFSAMCKMRGALKKIKRNEIVSTLSGH